MFAFDYEKALDTTSWEILCALQEDARLSFSELGRRVGLSAPAVAERVRKLEEAGIIAGYHARVCPEKIGYALMAFIRVESPSEKCPIVSAFIADLPEVLECHRVTGSDSFILKVIVVSVAHLEALLDRLMPYGQLTTSVVLSSPVKNRVIEPQEPASPN
ncbi:MAG TPA: Lrp/AsnC family transcriptional regulator [Ktedonobacterales bacterium]|jgi:Lrp/AsnC family leucine-responsive transcriptional regulator